MEPQPIEFEGTWEAIAAHASRFAGHRLRLTILPQEAPDEPVASDQRSLQEKIAEVVAAVPEEEWAKLPSDLGDNLDHYIYGTPKRE
jgi:hypothetical protein